MRMGEGCAIRLKVQMSRLTSCPITLDAISRVSRTFGRRRQGLPVCQFASLPDENRYNGGKQTPGATMVLARSRGLAYQVTSFARQPAPSS